MDFFSLSLPNKKEFVVAARLLATSVAGTANFDLEAIEDIRMAVGEACNNVVVHSAKSDKIDLDIELLEQEMKITVKDHGVGFTRTARNLIDPEQYTGSGLGLFIIDALMDEVILQSGEEHGTIITMTKKR